ncbi:MAG: hypothetical protein GY768_23245 [Planctomycetaceae bacterium]|nr:hypothetical protein [Planctomycetaceae bacterium]
MSDHPTEIPTEPKTPTQAELYDDLRRIGELEDEKQRIQAEIDVKTQKLQAAVGTLNAQSLLCRMLKAVLQPVKSPRRKSSTRKTAAGKAGRKRS